MKVIFTGNEMVTTDRRQTIAKKDLLCFEPAKTAVINF